MSLSPSYLVSWSDGAQGTGEEYCANPQQCQRDYGRCDADAEPQGISTSRDVRYHVGNVPYGVPITQCTQPGTIALTFDDGPSDNTPALLDLLAANNANATFFVVGNSKHKGEIDTTDKWVQAIRRMAVEGHQVGSHTWSHPHLDELTSGERKEEMYKNERALTNIIGKYPAYMRPPYVECSSASGCLRDMSDLGYHVID